MTKPSECYSLFSEKRKKVSHIVWHAATGDWIELPEVLHHIDGNSFNNELSNLQLMSRSEHNAFHMRGKKHHQYGKTGKDSQAWKGEDASPHAKYMRWWTPKQRRLYPDESD